MMDDFERQVQGELDRLEGPDFPATRRARQQRAETIRALAAATIAGEPWTGENGVLGPKRRTIIVGEKNFYEKRHWYAHPLTREVIENVTALYLERDAAERERARQEKKAWLENKEMEAAETQFAKAGDLLALPHITKKTVSAGGETTIILDPANAAVFNAAVNLNKSASELARRALGLPTDTTRNELTGAAGGPVRTQEIGRLHDGAEHLAAVTRILVESGAVELRPVGQGRDAADDEVHPA